jgi:putative hydrolase of the HAD superfamily
VTSKARTRNEEALIVCVDLDDTLIPTAYRYNDAIAKCALLLTKAFGEKSLHPVELLARHRAIDEGLVSKYGYRADRFPTSWTTLYDALCKEAGIAPDPKLRARLRHTANRYQFGPYRAFAGSKKALTQIQRDGHVLHLVTAGDPKVQDRKISQSGLTPLFDGVHVTGVDKKKVIAGIVGDRPERGVMVGDSKRSDIQPAIDLGMTAVWLPSNTWAFAQVDVKGTFHTIRSIDELPALLRRISARVPRRLAPRAAGA